MAVSIRELNDSNSIWTRVRWVRGFLGSTLGLTPLYANWETWLWRPTWPNIDIAFFVRLWAPSFRTCSLTRSTRSKASCSRSLFACFSMMPTVVVSDNYKNGTSNQWDSLCNPYGVHSHSTLVYTASLLCPLDIKVITILLTNLKERLNGRCQGVRLSVIT